MKIWTTLTRNGKLALTFGVLGVVGLVACWYVWGSALTAWWVGIPQAIKANTEATRELDRASGVAAQARQDTAETLADYARTQETVRALAQQSGALAKKAEAALALARSKDEQIAVLQRALAQSDARRAAQPKTTTLQEAHDALAGIDPRFR